MANRFLRFTLFLLLLYPEFPLLSSVILIETHVNSFHKPAETN
nr:MAG TPA: hypothetical protein [Caudoviricetes sp.]